MYTNVVCVFCCLFVLFDSIVCWMLQFEISTHRECNQKHTWLIRLPRCAIGIERMKKTYIGYYIYICSIWKKEHEKRENIQTSQTHNLNVQCSESWWRGESDVNGISGARLLNNVSLKRVTGTAAHFYSFCYLSSNSSSLTLYVYLLPARQFFFCMCCALNFLHPVSCTHRQKNTECGIRERDKNIPDECLAICVYTWIVALFSLLLFGNAHLCAIFPRKLDDDIIYVFVMVLFSCCSLIAGCLVALRMCFSLTGKPLLVHRLLAPLYIYTYEHIKRAKSLFFLCIQKNETSRLHYVLDGAIEKLLVFFPYCYSLRRCCCCCYLLFCPHGNSLCLVFFDIHLSLLDT